MTQECKGHTCRKCPNSKRCLKELFDEYGDEEIKDNDSQGIPSQTQEWPMSILQQTITIL